MGQTQRWDSLGLGVRLPRVQASGGVHGTGVGRRWLGTHVRIASWRSDLGSFCRVASSRWRSLALTLGGLYFVYLFIWPRCDARRSLVPRPGIQPMPPAVEA